MQIQKPRQGYKLVKWLYEKEIEIPEEWEIKKIKDLTKVSVGLVINPSTYFDKNGTVPMITGKNVTENGIVLNDVDCITEKSNKLLETTRIWSGDLVTMRVGYPGRTSVVTKEHDGINCASVIITRENKKFVSQFLGYLANSKLVSKQIMMHQAGGAQQVVNIGSWKEFVIPFPPIHEQQKIALILSNIDSLIQQTQNEIEKTQILKRGLMQRLLTKGIGHTKFKETEFGAYFIRGETPESWKIDTVKNSSEKLAVGFVGTSEPYYVEDGGIPLLRTTNIKEGEFDLSNLKYVTKEFHERNKKSQVKEGDILVSRHGENGEACLVRNITEANCLNIVIIRPKKDLFLPEFFELAFNSPIVRRQIQRTTGGGVQDVVNTSEIGKAKMIIPALNEQSRIVSVFDNIRLQIQKQQKYKSKLETLKKGLMQKLLTGQIRVKN